MIARFTPDTKTGKRIATLRKEHNLSQRQLAQDIERVSYAYISRVERGQRTPSISALVAIASKLDTTALYLATGRDGGHPGCPVCGADPTSGLPGDVQKEIRDALSGDSNDAEHDALVSVAQHLGVDWTSYEDLDDDDPPCST